MTRLIAAFRSLPSPSQVAVIGLVLLMLLFVAGGVGGIVSAYKDRAFDKREAEREQQRQQLETEREQAIGKAMVAEARAKELEGQVRILEVTASAFGKQAEKVKEAIKDEEKKIADEMAVIDSDIGECERLQRICSRLKALNYYPKDKPCPECQ